MRISDLKEAKLNLQPIIVDCVDRDMSISEVLNDMGVNDDRFTNVVNISAITTEIMKLKMTRLNLKFDDAMQMDEVVNDDDYDEIFSAFEFGYDGNPFILIIYKNTSFVKMMNMNEGSVDVANLMDKDPSFLFNQEDVY